MERTYVVPHPPIILPEVGRGEEEKIHSTIRAYEAVAAEIAAIRPETIIISSPHAPYYQGAFYLGKATEATGDLSAFRVRGVRETVPVDRELCDAIDVAAEEAGIPVYYGRERASELDHGTLIPLRFIRQAFPDCKIVRLGLSTLSSRAHYKLGMAIEAAAERLGRRCVYVASGDLSHVLREDGPYGYRKEGPVFDQKIVSILERGAFDELLRITPEEADAASQCGLGSFQIMAGTLDGRAAEAKLLSYEGPFGVGYAVLSFRPGDDDPGRHFLELRDAQPPEATDPYIELARAAIESYILEGRTIAPPSTLPRAMLEAEAGCFVTLHEYSELRGCIGTLEPVYGNLAEEIVQNAISAATRDPRFPRLQPRELSELEVSVDVLSPPEAIASFAELDPATYGVIVSHGRRRGVLLPDLEGVDTPEEQVAIALRKAGISGDEDYSMERFRVTRHEYRD